MPRRPNGGAVLDGPPTAADPLAADVLDAEGGLTYPELLRQAGAYRVPGRGIVHRLPFGAPFRQGGRWVQQTRVYPVAMSAEEAREKTRATGERHDYFEPGARCKRCAEAGGSGVISGWVLGGRKFQVEHEHVTDFDPAVYGVVEVEAPDVADDDGMADEAPVAMEA